MPAGPKKQAMTLWRSPRNKSGYYGVYPKSRGGGWEAQMRNPNPPYNVLYLGMYRTPEAAARVIAQRLSTLGITPYRPRKPWATCKYGHPLVPGNILFERHRRNGKEFVGRRCRKCRAEDSRRQWERKKKERNHDDNSKQETVRMP